MDSQHIEKELTDKLIYDGRILSLHVYDIELPNGKTSMRECVAHKDGAGILAVDNNEMYFVKQYRFAIRKEIVEIPAGLVEEGEEPKQTAFRELQEEIGLKPLDLRQILKIYPSPGFTDEATYIFFASKFEKKQLKADDDEFIEIIKMPIDEVRDLYQQGYFEDAKTVCALGFYFSNLVK